MDDITTSEPWSISTTEPWNISTDSPVTTETAMPWVTLNSTVAPDCPEVIPVYWGYATAAIAIFFYGTNFAPVKKFDTGDGMFFQWVVCAAIWVGGLVVNLIRNSPPFYPIVMIGGVVWETGNVCVVPIIKTIGLGLGLCVWGMTNLLSGWATGRFGLFGVTKEVPDNVTMNYIGVALAVCSAFVFSMIKNDISTENIDHTRTVDVNEDSPLLSQDYPRGNSDSLYPSSDTTHDVIVFNRRRNSSIQQGTQEQQDTSFIDNLSPSAKRTLGLVLSVLSGLLYGQMFTPSTALMNQHIHDKSYSQEALDYVFSAFSGIFLCSTVYFLIYCMLMKNKPKVYPRAILPGVVSGLMWSVATACWFVANKVLSEPVAFPIVTSGPAIIASLLGVFVFKEIRGRRNIIFLLTGFAITITGGILAGLSKKPPKSAC